MHAAETDVGYLVQQQPILLKIKTGARRSMPACRQRLNIAHASRTASPAGHLLQVRRDTSSVSATIERHAESLAPTGPEHKTRHSVRPRVILLPHFTRAQPPRVTHDPMASCLQMRTTAARLIALPR